jgi:hypothetical protein
LHQLLLLLLHCFGCIGFVVASAAAATIAFDLLNLFLWRRLLHFVSAASVFVVASAAAAAIAFDLAASVFVVDHLLLPLWH